MNEIIRIAKAFREQLRKERQPEMPDTRQEIPPICTRPFPLNYVYIGRQPRILALPVVMN
jgi:hypothetical protein